MRYWPILAALPMVSGQAAWAQDGNANQPNEPEIPLQPAIVFYDPAPPDMYSIVVTGDRTHVDYLNQPLTVIGLDEIRVVQGTDITRILQRAPGLTFSRNGGPGSVTSVRLRGSEADQLLVLLDGVPLNDVSAPAGGYDFASMLPAGISQVEVLRGSNSTIWGSRALGGVIGFVTQNRSDTELLAEVGTAQSASLQGSGGYFSDDFRATLNGAFARSSGTSAADGGVEADGFRQWQMGGTFLAMPIANIEMDGSYRHADLRAETDGFPAPDFLLADTDEWQRSRLDAGHLGLTYWTDGFLLKASYAVSQTRRANLDGSGSAPVTTFAGNGISERLDLRGETALTRRLDLQFGALKEWSRYRTSFDARATTMARAGYAQLDYRGPDVEVRVGLRRDEFRDFGGQWSLGADGAVEIGDDWRVRASYGQGFKAPTLFQLRSDYGNPALRPERSRSFDLALHKGVRNFRSSYAVTLFRRDARDQIGFLSCFGVTDGLCAQRPFGTYDNIDSSRAQGVEAEAMVQLSARLTGQAAAAYIDTRDRSSGGVNRGNRLARRPAFAGTFSLDWEALGYEEVYFGADLRLVSSSFDDPANNLRLGGHAVLDLRTRWNLAEDIEAFGRLENVWNEQYQTAAGYASTGRSAYVGMRVRM